MTALVKVPDAQVFTLHESDGQSSILRQCLTCGFVKEASHFRRTPKGLYGLRSQCRSCERVVRTSPDGSRKAVARVKAWRLANPSRARKLANAMARRHTQRHNAYRRRTGYADVRRRRARKRGAQNHHTQAEWLILLDRLGSFCLRCLRCDVPMTRDHVVPLAKGGDDSIDNIQPLCNRCNNVKGTRAIDYRT